MRIADLSVSIVSLPFRFAFKHSLASRTSSENIIVRAVVEDDRGLTKRTAIGFGEGVPRDYVTGETADGAREWLQSQVFRRFSGQKLADSINPVDAAVLLIKEIFADLMLDRQPRGSAFCAVELAILDAVARLSDVSLAESLAKRRGRQAASVIKYGGVVPFSGNKSLKGMLWFYRLYGFSTVKLKVGDDFEKDLFKLRLAREILGPPVVIRVDANCAWTAAETVQFSEKARPYNIQSIEQPVKPESINDLIELTRSLKEEIVVDESLLTIEQARNLAERKACGGFNIRVSKVGGIVASQAIADIAYEHGINCHLGAQVGESGILTAAGRALAAAEPPFANYEGAANWFLLKEDLTEENLTCGLNGKGRVLFGPGLGVTVIGERLSRLHARNLRASTVLRDNREVIERGAHA